MAVPEFFSPKGEKKTVSVSLEEDRAVLEFFILFWRNSIIGKTNAIQCLSIRRQFESKDTLVDEPPYRITRLEIPTCVSSKHRLQLNRFNGNSLSWGLKLKISMLLNRPPH